MRFTKDKAKRDPHYVDIYDTCDRLLRNVHHFGFDDVVQTLKLEAWSAHIRWDWVKEWLELELKVLTEKEVNEDDDGNFSEDITRRISDAAPGATKTRPLDPLAQPFFNLKSRERKKADREDERQGTSNAIGVALERVQRAVADDALDAKTHKRGVGQYYATGSGKRVKGYSDGEFAGHSFAKYGKRRALKAASTHLKRHDERSESSEKILPIVQPRIEQLEASNG